MSFLDAFRLVAVIAMCCLHLILIAGRPRGGVSRAAAAAAAEFH